MNPLEWIQSLDTGISSKTIWEHMTGIYLYDMRSRYVPCDPSDFGRCYRLLQAFPEWKVRLPELAERYPAWRPFVERWDEMERIYLRDLPTGESAELFDLMWALRSDPDIAVEAKSND